MKPSGYIRRKSPLSKKGKSETADIKQQIQNTVRDIVILRDGGCIFQKPLMAGRSLGIPYCNGYYKAGNLIFRPTTSSSAAIAQPTPTRAPSSASARGTMAGKSVGGNQRKKEYDAIVRTLLPPDRVALWDRCEQESWRATRTSAMDWKLQLAALEAELSVMRSGDRRVSTAFRGRATTPSDSQ